MEHDFEDRSDATYGLEAPVSPLRLFTELVFYLTVLVSAFESLVPLEALPSARGAMVMGLGVLAFLNILRDRKGLPFSIIFAAVIAAGANLSQFCVRGEPPLMGSGVSSFTHWFSYLCAMCYLARNRGAAFRMGIFFAVTIGASAESALSSGAPMLLGEEDRLLIEGASGLGLSNANDLAYMAGFFSILCLFLSLRALRALRPLLWVLAFVLALVLIRTVSRGGMAAFLLGGGLFVFAVIANRETRLTGIVLAFVIAAAVLLAGYMLSDYVEFLGERVEQASIRTSVLREETLHDLWDTKLFGKGPGTRVTGAGITAHNSFLYVHMCYGGLTAWPYLAWILFLAMRLIRLVRSEGMWNETSLLLLAVFGMSLASQMLSNMGFMFPSSIYAAALIEKHTTARREPLEEPA